MPNARRGAGSLSTFQILGFIPKLPPGSPVSAAEPQEGAAALQRAARLSQPRGAPGSAAEGKERSSQGFHV